MPADLGAIVALLDDLAQRLGVDVQRAATSEHSLLHPGRAFTLEVAGQRIGVAGELHPAVARDLELDGPVSLAEIALAELITQVPDRNSFQGLSTYPPVRQDIAVVVDTSVEAASLLGAARDAGGNLFTDAEVFDVFEDAERLGRGKHSMALRLVFQADDRTLTEEEASEVRERIVATLTEHYGAELRG